MKDDSSTLETTLLSAGSGLMRRGYSAILKNCGKLIATLTAVIVVLVTFTEVGFYEVGASELTANLLLTLVASYVIYFSLEDAGERLGKDGEEYQTAARELRAAIESVEGEMLPALRDFLEEYRQRELKQRREAILMTAGLSSGDLEPPVRSSCKRQERRTLGARAAIRRARAQRPLRLNAGMLLAGSSRRGRELRNPQGMKFPTLLLRLIPTTVCTLFTASVMLGVKDGLGAAEVIEGLVRLCPLPIVALRGYSAGYSYVTEEECEWMRAKRRLLDAFLRAQAVKASAQV